MTALDTFYRKPFPCLSINARHILREQEVNDAEAFFSYYSNPNVNQYILATPPTDLADAKSEIQYCRNLFYNKRGIYWSIARRDNNKVIGAVGIYLNNHHRRGEICYDLAEPYWRQGIMNAALRTVIDFAFQTMQLIRIEALTMKENIPSQNILLKIGFEHEGCLRNYRYYKNNVYNVEIFAITPEMYAVSRTQVINQAHLEQNIIESVAP